MIRYRKHPWRAVADMPGAAAPIVDPRRMAAAKRALAAKREREGLFAETEVTDDAAIARLVRMKGGREEQLRRERDQRARDWRTARRALRALPDDVRAELLWRWNTKRHGPADPAYLMTAIRGTCHPGACAIIASAVVDPWLDQAESPFVLALVSRDVLADLPRLREEFRERLSAFGQRARA